MNLLLLEPEELAGDRARITGRRVAHVRTVLGKGVGDTLAVGRTGGPIGEATIVAVDDDTAELQCTFDHDPPAASRVTLVLALPRPPMFRRIFQHVTAMGVKTIVLIHSARVEKSYWDSHDLKPEAIAHNLRLGLEQAGDTILPAVHMHRRFRPFVEDELAGLAGDSHRLLATAAPHASVAPHEGSVTLVVGPEGGFVPFERALFAAHGFAAWSLGPRVLRVETAVVASLGRLG